MKDLSTTPLNSIPSRKQPIITCIFFKFFFFFSIAVPPLPYIIGGAVGGVAVLFIIALACVLYQRYKREDSGSVLGKLTSFFLFNQTPVKQRNYCYISSAASQTNGVNERLKDVT